MWNYIILTLKPLADLINWPIMYIIIMATTAVFFYLEVYTDVIST